MKADEIEAQMTEFRQYDVLSGETQYRWDYSIYGVADKYRPGKADEETWAQHARARAAAKIELMMASQHNKKTVMEDDFTTVYPKPGRP